jgi:hypothetical protein
MWLCLRMFGEPTGVVAMVTRNPAGQAQRMVPVSAAIGRAVAAIVPPPACGGCLKRAAGYQPGMRD